MQTNRRGFLKGTLSCIALGMGVGCSQLVPADEKIPLEVTVTKGWEGKGYLVRFRKYLVPQLKRQAPFYFTQEDGSPALYHPMDSIIYVGDQYIICEVPAYANHLRVRTMAGSRDYKFVADMIVDQTNRRVIKNRDTGVVGWMETNYDYNLFLQEHFKELIASKV